MDKRSLMSLMEALRSGDVSIRELPMPRGLSPIGEEPDNNPIVGFSFIPLNEETRARQFKDPIVTGDTVRTENGDYVKMF